MNHVTTSSFKFSRHWRWIFHLNTSNLLKSKWTSTPEIWTLVFSRDGPLKIWSNGQGYWLEIDRLLVQGSQRAYIFWYKIFNKLFDNIFLIILFNFFLTIVIKYTHPCVTILSQSLIVLNRSGLKEGKEILFKPVAGKWGLIRLRDFISTPYYEHFCCLCSLLGPIAGSLRSRPIRRQIYWI